MEEERNLGTLVIETDGNGRRTINFLVKCIACFELFKMERVRICDDCHKVAMCDECLDKYEDASHLCNNCIPCPSCKGHFKCEFAICIERMKNAEYYYPIVGYRLSVAEAAAFLMFLPLRFYLDGQKNIEGFWEFKIKWDIEQWFIFLSLLKHHYNLKPSVSDFHQIGVSVTEKERQVNINARRLKIIVLCTLLRIIFYADSNAITFPFIDIPGLDLPPVCPRSLPYPMPDVDFLATGVGGTVGPGIDALFA